MMAAGRTAWVWVPALVAAICCAVPAASQPQLQAPLGGQDPAILVEEEVHDGEAGKHEAVHAGHEEAEHSGHELAESHHGGHHGGADHAAAAGHGAEGGHGAHAGGKHHGGHAGGHHISKTILGTTTAVMLMGFVAFIMALFYLVNWHDEDIRQYTWVVISVTVSIFVAVLTYSAFRQAVEFFLTDAIVMEFVSFLLLWVLTQSLLFVFKDVNDVGAPEGDAQPLTAASDRTASEEGGGGKHAAEAPDKESGHDTPNVPLKAFGQLMAHITGFAAIQCFGDMQLKPHSPFASSWLTSALMLPVFGLVAYVLIFTSQFTRKVFISSTGDMKEDKNEELWREQCRETEDDAVGLCFSSITCVVFRYAITGVLPTAHGSVEGRQGLEVAKLFLAGTLVLAVLIGVTYKINQRNAGIEAEQPENMNDLNVTTYFHVERFLHCLQICAGLTMSWCYYFATQWGFFVFLQSDNLKGVAGKLLQAVLVSFGCTLVIFVLDVVGDGSDSCKKALKGLITSLGLLVGISWEGAFAMGVEEIAVNWETKGHQLAVKIFLALSLVMIVLPAWRLFILPKSDPEIWRYYQGRLPPLSALWRTWDPVKDYKPSKSEKHKHAAKARTTMHAMAARCSIRRASH